MVNVTFSGGHCCRCESPCMHTSPPTYCYRHNLVQTVTNNMVYSTYIPPKHENCIERCGCFWRGKYDEKGSVIESYEEKIRLAYQQGLENGLTKGKEIGYNDATEKLKGEE